ncbi:MAG TPA: hypothetical protein VH063_12205 [Gaiellaceae bacterium]|jgi:hypothetical protein|nr:hypothetical protein [Gaiellaceae bacterium]
MQGSHSGRRSAVRSGLLTGLSTAAVSASAGLAGALLARKFGHGAKTDGFFAAYAVYLAIVLVASALRVVVLPEFARARAAGALGREVGSWSAALAVPLVPAMVVAIAAPHWVAGLLTGGSEARSSAAELVPWLIPAAVAQVYAGIAASALAALDDYGTAALGYAAGGLAGLLAIVALVSHGVQAFGWGLALNGAVSLSIPLAVVLSRGGLGLPGGAVLRRLRMLVEGVSLPFALQGLYVIGTRFASGLGSGRTTTFSYAYLIASLLVAVTATSIALVSSVPLSRGELTPERTARHVISASWVSFAIVAGAAGVFALAGAPVAKLALGSSYGGGTGTELGRLVAYLSPWMICSIALSVAFPLLFVRGRARWLPLLAIGALVAHVLIEWGGSAWLGLAGIAAGMAVTTLLVLLVLLASLGALPATSRGVLGAAAACAAPALLGFGVAGLVLDAAPAAVLGFVIYAAALALWRPRGLLVSWHYLRHLGAADA